MKTNNSVLEPFLREIILFLLPLPQIETPIYLIFIHTHIYTLLILTPSFPFVLFFFQIHVIKKNYTQSRYLPCCSVDLLL
ncbi:hypothetical protein AB4K20DRAFT_1020211 [Rhizopus microsporus]